MLRFKTFLLEYLTAGQREKFSHIKMTDKARKDTDHFFGEGNDLVKEPLISDYTKSETHEDVENHLGIKIPDEHYIKGVATDKYGRLTKIGKQIKDPSLLQRFSNDTARSNSSKPSDNYVTVVRGTEVAGQTNPVPNAEHPKGHSWKDQSCKNIECGVFSNFLAPEIQHGSVLFRVHNKAGKEIHRTIIQPYHNNSGETVYGLAGQYGVQNDRYTKHANDIAARLSNSNARGIFSMNRSVYQDSAPDEILSPHISSEEISDILRLPTESKSLKLHILSTHKNITSQHIFDAIDNNDNEFGEHVINNPNIRAKHINYILNKPKLGNDIKLSAITHKLFTSDHITNFLKNYTPKNDDYLLNMLPTHKSFNSNHLDILLSKNLIPHMAYSGIGRLANNISSKQQLDKIIEQTTKIPQNILYNTHIHTDHITKLLDKNDNELNNIIYQHPKFDDSHASHIINSDLIHSADIYKLAGYNLKPHHINDLINNIPSLFETFNEHSKYSHSETINKILSHPNFNGEHRNKLLKLNNHYLNKRINMYIGG